MPTPNETPANGQDDPLIEFERLLKDFVTKRDSFISATPMQGYTPMDTAGHLLRAHVRKMAREREEAKTETASTTLDWLTYRKKEETLIADLRATIASLESDKQTLDWLESLHVSIPLGYGPRKSPRYIKLKRDTLYAVMEATKP